MTARRDALQAARDESRRQIDVLLNITGRDLTNAEAQHFEHLRSEVIDIDASLAQVDETERRAGVAARARVETGMVEHSRSAGGWSVGREAGTYSRGDSSTSWIKDIVAFGLRGDPGAAERLNRNTREVATQFRALSTGAGAGGEFTPPLWLVQEYVTLARAARVAANLLRQEVMPAGTNVITVPKVLTGTATAAQATENTAVQNTDATFGSVSSAVSTIAGGQLLSVQLVEQSAVDMTDIILTDLLNDLAVKIDTYSLASNVANARGILHVPGAGAQTYTSATPTVAGLYGALAQARTAVEISRFMSPTAILMHPRRWSWLLASSDSANRPLIVPATGGATNAVGTMTADVSTVGQVGSLLGLPVYVDASMPLVGGQDQIVVYRPEDITLYESVPRAEAFRETYAPSLGIYLRVFEYVAISSERYPASIAIVGGTGLAAPVYAS